MLIVSYIYLPRKGPSCALWTISCMQNGFLGGLGLQPMCVAGHCSFVNACFSYNRLNFPTLNPSIFSILSCPVIQLNFPSHKGQVGMLDDPEDAWNQHHRGNDGKQQDMVGAVRGDATFKNKTMRKGLRSLEINIWYFWSNFIATSHDRFPPNGGEL